MKQKPSPAPRERGEPRATPLGGRGPGLPKPPPAAGLRLEPPSPALRERGLHQLIVTSKPRLVPGRAIIVWYQRRTLGKSARSI